MQVYKFAATTDGNEIPTVHFNSGLKAGYFKGKLALIPIPHPYARDLWALAKALTDKNDKFADDSLSYFQLFCNDPDFRLQDIEDRIPQILEETYGAKLVKKTPLYEVSFSSFRDVDTPSEFFSSISAHKLMRAATFPSLHSLRFSLTRTDSELTKDDNPFYNDMKEEIQRLHSSKNTKGDIKTAPVIYVFGSANESDTNVNVDTLVNTLNKVGILYSHEIAFLNLDTLAERGGLDGRSEQLGAITSEDFIRSLRGNTLCITYGQYDTEQDYNKDEFDMLKAIVSNINKHINDIQLIFRVPQDHDGVIKRLEGMLDKTLLVMKPEELPSLHDMSFDDAWQIAEDIAADLQLKPDKALAQAVKAAQKDFSAHDLKAVVRAWRDDKVVRNNFPAYKGILSAKKKARRIGKEVNEIEELDNLIGLKKAKKQLHAILEASYTKEKRRQQGLSNPAKSFHLAFLGNPGTGKTVVAELYAKILARRGIITSGRILELNAATGISTSDLEKGIGGVIVIDEAYELHRMVSGTKITEIVAFMESHRADTVLIFAGYKWATLEMIKSNPGFKSRLAGTIEFEDYSAKEKSQIFDYFCKENDYRIDPEARKYLEEEIINLPGNIEEGNARHVRAIFEKMMEAQEIRIHRAHENKKQEPTKDELRTFTLEDAKQALDIHEDIPGMQKLDALIGLNEVKRLLKERIASYETEAYKIREGISDVANRMPMHMVFTGNPGTGKTEVAKILGQILRERRVIGGGEIKEISLSDLHDEYHVQRVFEDAVGCVLFLDEAYALLNVSSDVIAALMKEMERHKNDVIFIMAGYTKEMNKLLSSNPGFHSRIAAEIEFPDYTEEELTQIFHFLANKEDLVLNASTDRYLPTLIANEKHRPSFGNGRSMRHILHRLKVKQGVRLNSVIHDEGASHPKNYFRLITAEDYQALYNERGIALLEDEKTAHGNQEETKTAREQLEELIGLEEVKELVKTQINHFKRQKERIELGYASKQNSLSMHMAFTGNPGTGKTVVARLVGQIMRDEGLLSVGSVREVGRQDLVAGYVGQTAPKVEKLFEENMGSVIFIDEAYSLLNGNGRDGFAQEAIDALIAQMENHRDDTVVILAGYADKIDELLASNAGFRSRVPNIVPFKDYSTDELCRILELHAAQDEYKLDKGTEKVIREYFDNVKETSGFGNGRDVRNLLERAILEHDSAMPSTKKKQTEDDYNLLTEKDFSAAVRYLGGNLKTNPKTKSGVGFIA